MQPDSKNLNIMILGNSISFHAPKTDIGWSGSWGMAASSKEKDYIHILEKSLREFYQCNICLCIINAVEFEKNYRTCDLDKLLAPTQGFEPEIIILSIVENIKTPANNIENELIYNAMAKLLDLLELKYSSKIFIRGSFWGNPVKDKLLKRLCREYCNTFIDISKLHLDENNFAGSERAFSNHGVAAHPGDKGMNAISASIVNEIINNFIKQEK